MRAPEWHAGCLPNCLPHWLRHCLPNCLPNCFPNRLPDGLGNGPSLPHAYFSLRIASLIASRIACSPPHGMLSASRIACRCSETCARGSAPRFGQGQAAVVKEAPTRALALAGPVCLAAPVQCRGAGAGVAASAAGVGAKAAAAARAMPRRRVWLSCVGGRRRASSLPKS